MVVTIHKKVASSEWTDPEALKAMDLMMSHGILLPLSPGGNSVNDKLVKYYSKAIKHEKKLRAKCGLKFNEGEAAFKKAAKTYLTDKRCLLVALFEDNRRRELRDRRSHKDLTALSLEYDVLKGLTEPARVWQQPKASGNGMRVICSFGPVARAAQRMVAQLLRLAFKPRDFQFDKLTFAQKVELAMTEIKEKGYTHVKEIDIKGFFDNFTAEALVDALPLPPEATRQIVLSTSAIWGPHPRYVHYGIISSPPGIPQGSASSAAVADWCIANMPLEKLIGTFVLNHADNFFAFAASSKCAADVSKALCSGISGMPGGDFSGKTEQAVEVTDGFQILGCWVTVSKQGVLEADPTDTKVKDLRSRAYRQRQRAIRRLTNAHHSGQRLLRIKGLQDVLRFESMVQGWVQAFAFCGPLVQDVKQDYDFQLADLKQTFSISDDDLKAVQDASTMLSVRWYSGG